MVKIRHDLNRAIAVMIGLVVGAGIFGLPYAFAQIGFLGGSAYLIIIALVILIVNFCYGETILRTKDELEMSGYVRRYLGQKGKILITLSFILGTYAAMIAYTIGVGSFLHTLLGPALGGSRIVWSVIFWSLASIILYKGIALVSRLETVMTMGLMLAVAFIVILAAPHVSMANLTTFHPENLFFPYGVILFSIGGVSAIPTMRRILNRQPELLKRAIISGTVAPALIYFAFAFAVVGVSGINTSEMAITGLAQFTNGKILLIGSIFGILTMSTSFLALGHILKELYQRDYHMPLYAAWGLSAFIPLLLFLSGLQSFIRVIGFSGGVLSGVQGIIMIQTYYHARKKGDREPEYKFYLPKTLAYIIFLIFIAGIVYQFMYH